MPARHEGYRRYYGDNCKFAYIACIKAILYEVLFRIGINAITSPNSENDYNTTKNIGIVAAIILYVT